MIFFSASLSKKNKVYPTQKTNFSPLLKRKSLIFFSASASKKCLSRLYKFVYKFCQQNFYIQICVLSIESVTKICQTNVHQFVTKSAQNLSLKSVHKFCQQDQQICQQLSLISSKVYILSAGICPQKNPRICKQFVTILGTICHYSGTNLSLFCFQEFTNTLCPQ